MASTTSMPACSSAGFSSSSSLSIDFDFTTDARPDAIKKVLKGWADAVWTQGEKFGTIGAKLNGPVSVAGVGSAIDKLA